MAPFLEKRFDVVIVGAGSAGCVLANRLSEDPNLSVGLVEAGRDYPTGWPDPIKYGRLDGNPSFDWMYPGYLSRDRTDEYVVARGKVVGGSSAINGAIYLRGVPEDYDSWGSPLWTHDALLPFLRMVESDHDFSGPFHGQTGPIPVTRPSPAEWFPFTVAFYEAALAAGFAEKRDLSHPVGNGVGPIPQNRLNGVRISSAMGYLDPVRSRPNLHIVANATASRVTFADGRATGVELVVDGHTTQHLLCDQVVLAASGIASPQLLMLSGIGPARALRELGIPLVMDLPGVGQNLRDHPGVDIEIALDESYGPPAGTSTRFQTALIYTASGGVRNDMRLFPVFVPRDASGRLMSSGAGVVATKIRVSIELPLSAGAIKLRSGDPLAKPVVHYRYLEHEHDLKRFREAVEIIDDLLARPQLAKLASRRTSPEDSDLSSPQAFALWANKTLTSSRHTSGTCKMAAANDSSAVVDFRGRVCGVANLTVADLSITPDVVRAPTNATAFAIGERIADFLRASL